MLFSNVLLGIDGSPSVSQALGRAIEIAHASGGRIGLLGVVHAPSVWFAMPPFALPISRAQLAADLEADARRQVDEAERSVPADVPVTKLLARGSATEALLAQAHDGPWDLIVVGDRALADRWPLGRRVGARLLRESPVPVLVVPGVSEPVPVPVELAYRGAALAPPARLRVR